MLWVVPLTWGSARGTTCTVHGMTRARFLPGPQTGVSTLIHRPVCSAICWPLAQHTWGYSCCVFTLGPTTLRGPLHLTEPLGLCVAIKGEGDEFNPDDEGGNFNLRCRCSIILRRRRRRHDKRGSIGFRRLRRRHDEGEDCLTKAFFLE